MEQNLKTYSSAQIVEYYEKYEGLQKPELAIMGELGPHLSEMNVLDIGIGAGRTAHYLLPRVKEYTGIDYSEEMVNACRARFKGQIPDDHLQQADVRDLSRFPADHFDLVFFSFNGIDYIEARERKEALGQIRRVLKPGGFFSFSTHNLVSLRHLPYFEFRLNLWAALKRVFEVRKIKKMNRAQLSEISTADFLTINDGAHNFSLNTCYIRPSYQTNMLKEADYKNIRLFTQSGAEITPQQENITQKDRWIYFLCSKA